MANADGFDPKQETDRILASIVESSDDAILAKTLSGTILSWNRGAQRIYGYSAAAERLFGYVAPEVIGRNVNLLMPAPYAAEHDGYLSRYLSTGEQKIIGIGREVTGRRKDGTTFPLHLSVGEMLVGGDRKFT